MIKKITILFITIILVAWTLSAQDRSDTLRIEHTEINLSVLNFSGQTIEGYAVLDVVSLVNNLGQIVLDLAPFTVDSVKVNGDHATFSHANSRLSVALAQPVNAATQLPVEVWYRGVPERDPAWGGFYFSGEYAYNMGVAMTRIPHSYGRCWFPCLDIFTAKSTYRCNITTPAGKMAICGGNFVEEIPLDNGTSIWSWEIDQPISSYLVSVAVGEYGLYESEVEGIEGESIPITIYAPPTHINHVQGSFANLEEIIQNYENLFGPHQFDRVGYVGVNFNGGAMEHAMNIGYPLFAINGNLSYESLLAHELAHSWFGNLVTCDKAEEMWINEGFARYCEILTDESLYHDDDPSVDPARVEFRNLHRSVLKSAHTDDGGYWALSAIPQNVTYGTTTYDKGGIIAHTLRHYMGDELFFSGMKSMFQDYAYQNINSEEMFNYLSQTSGMNMLDFYEAWVNQPGFLHFSIDSMRLYACPFTYKVYVRQRLHHANHFGNSNRIDLTFFGSGEETYTVSGLEFSGEYGVFELTLPFGPTFGVVDFHEKMADAVVDYNVDFTSPKAVSCAEAFCNITATTALEYSFLHLEYNLVTPDPLKTDNPSIYRISDNHYWRIEYTTTGVFEGYFQFRYLATSASQKDYQLVQGYSADDLLLLYRRDPSEDWRRVEFTKIGGASGYLRTTSFLPGEYVLAVGTKESSIAENTETELSLFPNPVKHTLEYQFDSSEDIFKKAEIYDTAGKQINIVHLHDTKGIIDVSSLPKGCYVIRFFGRKGTIVGKFVKE